MRIVHIVGVEPTRPKALEPKPSASANSTKCASHALHANPPLQVTLLWLAGHPCGHPLQVSRRFRARLVHTSLRPTLRNPVGLPRFIAPPCAFNVSGALPATGRASEATPPVDRTGLEPMTFWV